MVAGRLTGVTVLGRSGPARASGLMLRIALALAAGALALAAGTAAAAPPFSEPELIVSATFDETAAPLLLEPVALSSEPTPIAMWGLTTQTRRGASGQGLWCAGTQLYPTVGPSAFFPSYPYHLQFVQRSAEPVTLVLTRPVRLAYVNIGGAEVSGIVVRSQPGGGIIYKRDTDYSVVVDAQGYTTIARKTGTSIPSGATVYVDYKWPTTGTRGRATLELTQTAELFSAWLSFHYLMPSVGGGDRDSFSVSWTYPGHTGNADARWGFQLTSTWVPLDFALSTSEYTPLARRAGRVTLQFFEFSDPPGTPKNGQGVSIDDLIVRGYTYGPVRNLAAEVTSAGAVVLSWNVPARSAIETAPEERPVAYRVWRTLAGHDTWTELTAASGRVAGTSFIDTGLTPGYLYEYVVQAWEPDGDAHHGPQSVPLRVAIPGAVRRPLERLDAPAVTGTVLAERSFVVSGSLEPSHPAGITVARIELSADASGVVATFPAVAVDADGATSYVATVSVPAAGIWYLRAVHDDGDHERTVSHWTTVAAEPQQPTVTPSSPVMVTLASYGASHTISGGLVSEGEPVAGATVRLERSSDGVTFTATSLAATTSADGSFRFTVSPRDRTFYRVVFAGRAGVMEPAVSATVTVVPRVSLSAPVPSTTVYLNRTVRLRGSLRPRHPAGSAPVRIQLWRKTASGWRYVGAVSARVSDYSTYSRYERAYRFGVRGSWRLRAVHPSDGLHATTYSSYTYVRVR